MSFIEHEHFVGDLDVPDPVAVHQHVELFDDGVGAPIAIGVGGRADAAGRLAAPEGGLDAAVVDEQVLGEVVVVGRTLEVEDLVLLFDPRDADDTRKVRALPPLCHRAWKWAFHLSRSKFTRALHGLHKVIQLHGSLLALSWSTVVDAEVAPVPDLPQAGSIPVADLTLPLVVRARPLRGQRHTPATSYASSDGSDRMR